MDDLFPIIHEDAELLVINKPAGLVCHPTKGDVYSSLISRIRLYLGSQSTPHLINRLDRETSGVILVGKGPLATLEVRRIWEQRLVQKNYRAIVHGAVGPDHGLIDAPLGRDINSPVAIKDMVRPDGAAAATEFWVSRRFQRQGQIFTSLRIRPQTGRKHQIRIHLAYQGHPLVGDKLYGSDEQHYLAFVQGRLTDSDRVRLILPNHALHAQEVRFSWRDQERIYTADPEEWFMRFLAEAAPVASPHP